MPLTPIQGRWLYTLGRGLRGAGRGGVKAGRWMLTTTPGRHTGFFILGAYAGHKIQRGVQKVAARYVLPDYAREGSQPRVRFTTSAKL